MKAWQGALDSAGALPIRSLSAFFLTLLEILFSVNPSAECGLDQIGGVFKHLAPIVVAHHERWDGRRYPYGVAKTAIPFPARVLAVADSFDAMTSLRPYRQVPLTVSEAKAELRRGAGSQFDPCVVGAFLAMLGEQEQTHREGQQRHMQMVGQSVSVLSPNV